MKKVVLKLLPWVLLVSGMGLLVAFLILGLSRGSVQGIPDFSSADVSYALAFAMFLPMGAFIASRRPESPIGWTACGIGFLQILSGGANEYAVRALLIEPGTLPAGPEAAWLSAWTWIPGFALVAFLMLLFPTGRLPSRRWRWAAWLTGLTTMVLLVSLLTTWPERGATLILSEEVESAVVPFVVLEIVVWLLFLALTGSFASIIARFRRSTGVERQQLKWMAYVAGVAGVLLALTAVEEWLGVSETTLGTVTEHLLNLSAGGVPVATAIAVLRYRLYDIDLIINRTLVYGTLSGILVATYVGVVFTLQRLLDPITQESDLAIAASTLTVAALFRPLRSRVQGFIDRRFYRRKFDVQRTLETFSVRMKDEVDLGALSGQLVGVVEETMQPSHVFLWLREAAK